MNSAITVGAQNVVINEVATNNVQTLPNGTVKNLPDWIEFYNPSAKKVNLKGFHLTDDISLQAKFTFSKFIVPANGYAVLYFSNNTNEKPSTNSPCFKLSKGGEEILFTNKKGEVIDHIKKVALAVNNSYARFKDGAAYFEITERPTKGISNDSSPGISFTHETGFYTAPFRLILQPKTNCELRYTLNGELPHANSPVYPDFIEIKQRRNSPSDLANLRVSYKAIKMLNPNLKGTFLRVACFKNGEQISRVYNKSYFVIEEGDEQFSGLDVVTIITDKDNLFARDSGIYSSGGLMRLNKPTANFYQKGSAWERPANITYLNKEGVVSFSNNIGLRIHGGKTRKNAQKSFRIYARECYGANVINHDFFKDSNSTKHKKVILRAVNSAWGMRYMSDDITAEICKNLKVEVLDSHPVLVFINGEFWGIYSLREYFDQAFIQKHYNIPKEDVSIAQHGVGLRPDVASDWGIIKGDTKDLTALYYYIEANSLADSSNYAHVKKVLDIESIIDYYCAEIFFNNRDWPTNNNKLWKSEGGKWQQVFYDLDASFTRFSENTFIRILKEDGKRQNAPYATLLLRRLITSPIFVAAFVSRMKALMDADFAAYKIIALIDKYENLFKNVMGAHTNRYSDPKNKYGWGSHLELMRQFARQRKTHMLKHLKEVFGQ